MRPAPAALLLAAAIGCAAAAPLPPDSRRSGGDTTRPRGADFTRPAANLSLERQREFYVGFSFFRDPWVRAPASTTARDGLGPVFDARSCLACHPRAGRAPAPSTGAAPLGLVVKLGRPDEAPTAPGGRSADPIYGDQLQRFGVDLGGHRGRARAGGARGGDGAIGEAGLALGFEPVPGRYPDGQPYELRRPRPRVEALAYGPLDPGTRLSLRMATPLFGMGLLEAVDEADILAGADPTDSDGDGISGRPNRVWDPAAGRVALGRFGHKAGQVGVLQQTAAALRDDIGITSRLHPAQPCTAAQVACLAAPHGNDPAGVEISDALLSSLTYFTRLLAVPARAPGPAAGERHFHAAGCAACHRPGYRTGTLPGFPELSGQRIWPYSDLLLHDMGPELADQVGEFAAEGAEWRTAPLWGLGVTAAAGGLLHDGRARSIEEAILWHGGEAGASRAAFMALDKSERAALLAFLESL